MIDETKAIRVPDASDFGGPECRMVINRPPSGEMGASDFRRFGNEYLGIPSPGGLVVIWSGKHGAYWRRKGEGYTGDIYRAGIWPRADAESLIEDLGPEQQVMLRPAPPEVEMVHLELQSGDPHFRPDRPVTINGYRFVPAEVEAPDNG